MNATNTSLGSLNNAPVAERIHASRYAAAVAKAVRLIRAGKAKLLISVPLYRCWWRLRGLDFGIVSVEDLGLEADRASQHKDGGGPLLCDLLNQLEISPADAALDIGSGKGGAMATLARYPFRNVDGVEICRKLAEAARRNLAKLKLSRCRIFVADATTFTDLDRYTYIFMYNPFPEPILQDVLANIDESLRRRPRVIRLIYSNPLHEEAILASGAFTKSLLYQPYPEYCICVYESVRHPG
jgi:hypothetical protein